MAYRHAIAGHQEGWYADPTIRGIGMPDVFNAEPGRLTRLILIYPLVTLFLARLSFGYDLPPLLFPLAAGFALLGPVVAAIGLYERGRRRERGREIAWRRAFGVVRSPSPGAIITPVLPAGPIPFLVGLCVVLPVLGRATWYPYLKVVAW